MAAAGGPYTFFHGAITTVDPEQGCFWIHSSEANRIYGCDVRAPLEELQSLAVGQDVIFEVAVKQGKPHAQRVGPLPGLEPPTLRSAPVGTLDPAAMTGEGVDEQAAHIPLHNAPVCCFFLQRRCRQTACPDQHEDIDNKPCGNNIRGCKMHAHRNEKYGLRRRYDPVQIALSGGETAPMKAIKPLGVDARPSIPPPGFGQIGVVPKYLQRRRDQEAFGSHMPKWQGVVRELPDGPHSRGSIHSEDAMREYGCYVWVPPEHMLPFMVGDEVEFDLVLDSNSRPQARAVEERRLKVPYQRRTVPELVPVQNRGLQAKLPGKAALPTPPSVTSANMQKVKEQNAERMRTSHLTRAAQQPRSTVPGKPSGFADSILRMNPGKRPVPAQPARAAPRAAAPPAKFGTIKAGVGPGVGPPKKA